MAKKSIVTWTDVPAEHDYPAAKSFLELLAPAAVVEVLVALLSQAPTVHRDAKDILRAARLPLLPADDPAVHRDLKRAGKGTPLSPVLLVRGDLGAGRACRSLMVITGCAPVTTWVRTPRWRAGW